MEPGIRQIGKTEEYNFTYTPYTLFYLFFGFCFEWPSKRNHAKSKCFLEHNNFEFVQQDWANTRTRRLWKLQKEKKGAAIRLYWKDRTPDEIPGLGSYKEKSHIVEGSHVQFEY